MVKHGSRLRQPLPVDSPCPCGRPRTYTLCCGRLHSGESKAATAEDLMRSRYSAFVVGDEEYLSRSWHPDTRPRDVGVDADTVWTGLEILGSTEGTPFHDEGTVEFRARYREGGRDGEIHENSRFLRHRGAWVYLDALGGR